MHQIYRTALQEASRRERYPNAILEIGCGRGAFAAALAMQFPNARVTALDPSERAITKAQGRFVQHTNIQFVEGFAEQLPVPDNSVDLAFANLSFHHWEDKQKGLGEVARVLKPGGLFILNDPLAEGLLKNNFIRSLAQLMDGGVFSSPENLCAMLELAGLSLDKIQPAPGGAKTIYQLVATKK